MGQPLGPVWERLSLPLRPLDLAFTVDTTPSRPMGSGTASANVCLHLWTLTERARGGPIGHSYEGRVTQRVGAFCVHRLP
jgi:hypothetical protein